MNWDKKTRKYRLVKTAKFKNKQEKLSRYVITMVRSITVQGAFAGDYRVEIRGTYLNQILYDIYLDSCQLPQTNILKLDENETNLLFHAKGELETRLQKTLQSSEHNATLVFELQAVLDFIQEHFGGLMVDLLGIPEMHISFKHIWTLFPPHVLVYSVDALGQVQIGRVESTKFAKQTDGSLIFIIQMNYLTSDGEVVGWNSRIGKINEFPNTMHIHHLPVAPLKLHKDYPNIMKELVQRGDVLLGLHGRHLQEYKGHGLDGEGKRFNSHGRVMLDPITFNKVQPNNDILPYIRQPIAIKNITDEHKMLLIPLLYGFSLGDKVWGAFALSGLSEVSWDDTIIDSLVLEPERKAFVRALVRTHGFKDEDGGEIGFDDFVRDKGKGLVGLLAGPPGVGKTLTAEAVAEIAHRPLYTASSGELGDSASGLQERLTAIFELAEIWQAVVLLDEADVFLASRSLDNLKRNAITSIFLRHLEYYQGILLLTTNRLTSLDPAFQSRIHFCLQYEDLDVAARLAIWNNFVGKIRASQATLVDLNDDDLATLAAKKLNGRQIKNCMFIAQAIATENRKPIQLSELIRAIEFSYDAWIHTPEM